MPWLFLAASVVGSWFTLNAYRPARRGHLVGVSFLAAWFTGELVWWHLAWQAVATLTFVALGALEAWPGWVALGITLGSWVGLVRLAVSARQAATVIERTLREGLSLPEDHPLRHRVPMRQLVLPLYLRDRRVVRVKDVVYGPAGRRNRLDVYRRRGPAPRGAPVLLQIHGGAWVVGDKGQQGLPLMLEMAAAGWVCVATNYRLSPRAVWPDHLVDCKRALAWIREHAADYGGDPDLVFVTGGSAGGHLAAMTALTANEARYQAGFEAVDTRVRACVPVYGVYDLATVFAPRGRGARVTDWFARSIMGTTVAQDRSRFEAASPIHNLRADAPPFFVVHGTADNLVPVVQAREFVAALRSVSRNPVLYAEIPGASHAFDVFHSVRTSATVHGVRVFLEDVAARAAAGPSTVAGAAATNPPLPRDASLGDVGAASAS